MSTRQIEKRRCQLHEVVGAVVARSRFDRAEVQTVCKEAKTRFVGNVLKQLTADSVLGLVQEIKGGK